MAAAAAASTDDGDDARTTEHTAGRDVDEHEYTGVLPDAWGVLHLQSETSIDNDGEDRIYHYKLLEQLLKYCGIRNKFIGIRRICDGCGEHVRWREIGIEFKCCRCGKRYDMCHECQCTTPPPDSKCPTGYGCATHVFSSLSRVRSLPNMRFSNPG